MSVEALFPRYARTYKNCYQRYFYRLWLVCVSYIIQASMFIIIDVTRSFSIGQLFWRNHFHRTSSNKLEFTWGRSQLAVCSIIISNCVTNCVICAEDIIILLLATAKKKMKSVKYITTIILI